MYRFFLSGFLLSTLWIALPGQVYERIPEDIEKFTSLEEALKDPLSVLYLDLSKSRLKEFPHGILELENLRYLVLSKNQIEYIPDSLGKLSRLEYLDLSRNNILTLPPSIGDLKNLRVLILRRTPIYTVSDELCELKLLNHLDIWGTQITVLPECIGNLSASLNTLNMRHLYMSKQEQERIINDLPETRVYLTTGCKCDE